MIKPMRGNIHTVFLETPVNDLYTVDATEPIVHECVNKHVYTNHNGQPYFKQVFNPNPAILPTHFNIRRCVGECTSLAEYDFYRGGLLDAERIGDRPTKTVRVDFKFDMMDESQIAEWVKVCDVLIQAFIVKHKVTDKNNQTTTTHTGAQHKNASAKSGALEIVNYNKKAQQESNGAEYRLELHTLDTKGKTEREVLEAWQRELKSLVRYYDEAIASYNDAIIQGWTAATGGTKDVLRLNQFLYSNSSRLFSRQQLRKLYGTIGREKTDEQTKKASDNYCQRFCHLFVSRTQFAEFISRLCDGISKYIDGNTLDNEVFSFVV